MFKKKIDVPKYEKVQVGVDQKDVWVTSEGKEFFSKVEAENHEFLWKITSKSGQYKFPYIKPQVCSFETKDDFLKFEELFLTYGEKGYNIDGFSFPCTLVRIIEQNYCDCKEDCYCDTDLIKFVPLQTFKEEIAKMIESVSDPFSFN